jgi:predicted Rossmann fold flavoprotein
LIQSQRLLDLIIVGAGAAGLMAAMTAGARGKSVLLLDHNNIAGAKILISGGGRCNFTNIGTGPQNFISRNPHFARSALSRYTPQDFLTLIAKHKIAWHEKTLGQLFCDGSAKQIVAMLLAECADANVEVKLNAKITELRKSENFIVETTQGIFESRNLVLATGGLSIPKMGATGFAYDVARKFGLKIVEPEPGLVPLRAQLKELELYSNLSGVSIGATVRANGVTFRENILFTHRGLSGPAILQISSYLSGAQAFEMDLAPDTDVQSFLKDRKHNRPKAELKTCLAEIVPQRLAQAIAPDVLMGQLSIEQMGMLNERLKCWVFQPVGSEGFAKAEVTVGGIDTDELSSKSLESKSVRGLFVIGEAVDVTGWLGGYNFQWAWASGSAAAINVG